MILVRGRRWTPGMNTARLRLSGHTELDPLRNLGSSQPDLTGIRTESVLMYRAVLPQASSVAQR